MQYKSQAALRPKQQLGDNNRASWESTSCFQRQESRYQLACCSVSALGSQATVPRKPISVHISWKGLDHEVEQDLSQQVAKGPCGAPTGPERGPQPRHLGPEGTQSSRALAVLPVPAPVLYMSLSPGRPGLANPRLPHLGELWGRGLGLDDQALGNDEEGTAGH